MALVDTVSDAIKEIRATFPESTVTIHEDGEGGALVVVDPVKLGDPYAQAETWAGFRITFQYPYSDVYPVFVRGDLSRSDGSQLGEALSQTTFENRSAIQVSRRSNKLNPATDTAAIKLLKVLEWLRTR
jgi:hypothetical protein